MKRRDFLTHITGASLAGLACASLPASALAASASEPLRQLRADAGGRILESLDGGATWRQAARFAGFEVVELRRQGDAFCARLQFGPEGEHAFWLTSEDGCCWRTSDGPVEA